MIQYSNFAGRVRGCLGRSGNSGRYDHLCLHADWHCCDWVHLVLGSMEAAEGKALLNGLEINQRIAGTACYVYVSFNTIRQFESTYLPHPMLLRVRSLLLVCQSSGYNEDSK